PDLVIYESSGCESCAGTGFRGRTGIFELLLVDEDVGRLINRRAPTAEIRALAREKGMRTLIEDGVEKVRRGLTTPAEILRVTQE
ncbi:MAG: type II secretion system protein GspE, partial [Deltaproteobacteria bacterium]